MSRCPDDGALGIFKEKLQKGFSYKTCRCPTTRWGRNTIDQTSRHSEYREASEDRPDDFALQKMLSFHKIAYAMKSPLKDARVAWEVRISRSFSYKYSFQWESRASHFDRAIRYRPWICPRPIHQISRLVSLINSVYNTQERYKNN
jgi:hypothetical protein